MPISSSIQRYPTQCQALSSILRAPETQVCSTQFSLVLMWRRPTVSLQHQISTKDRSNKTNLNHRLKQRNKLQELLITICLRKLNFLIKIKAMGVSKSAQFHNSITIQSNHSKKSSAISRRKTKNGLKCVWLKKTTLMFLTLIAISMFKAMTPRNSAW